MHKKHCVSFSRLLMAALIIMLSPSLTGLHAKVTGRIARGGKPEAPRHASSLSGISGRGTEHRQEAASVRGDRFLVAEGRASYYANRFHGRKTASGEHFDRHDFTAAHRSLPFGTKVRVTNLENGKKVVVKINDRGPHTRNRIIDISQAAARELGMVRHGVENVRIEAYN